MAYERRCWSRCSHCSRCCCARWCWCPCPRLASMERLSTPSPALASFLLSFTVLRASSPPSQPTTSFCHFSLFLFSHFSICGANERTNKRMSEQTRSTFNTLKCRNFGCFFAHKTILMLVVCRLAHTTRSTTTSGGWPWCACGAVGGWVAPRFYLPWGQPPNRS